MTRTVQIFPYVCGRICNLMTAMKITQDRRNEMIKVKDKDIMDKAMCKLYTSQ
jgi:hypothetical protein